MAPNNEPRKYLTAYEEIQAVPRQWEIKFEGKNKRVAFYRLIGTKLEAQGTYEHPIFGWLPRPWELRKRPGAEGYYYYNISTDESVEHGPRKVRRPPSPPPGSIRVRREGMGTLVRQEISRTPLYDKYPRVFTLDAGDGYIGGMNGGVYVVRSTKTKQPYVEKVFRGTHAIYERLAKSEIEMMRRLIHNSIIRRSILDDLFLYKLCV
jgi:NIMA (never in mitosis gene a)-related kinase